MGFPTAGVGFSARGTISRSQYGLNVLQPQAGAPNSGVADNVELVIEAEFNRPNAAGDLPAPAQPREPVN
jgi:polyisoprenoid-binding protein YceI